MDGTGILIFVSVVMFAVLGLTTVLAHIYNLNSIKAKTVGDGQHGTARWARKDEIRKTCLAGRTGPSCSVQCFGERNSYQRDGKGHLGLDLERGSERSHILGGS